MNSFDPKQFSTISKVVAVIGLLLIVLLIFEAGIVVGYRKADFSSRWNSIYQNGTNGPHSVFAPFLGDSDDRMSHGAAGVILSVKLPAIMIKDTNGTEQIISVGTSTTIRMQRRVATAQELIVGNHIIVIGVPNDQGVIEATFIRVGPSVNIPASTTPSSTTPKSLTN